jgi:hypothetical protein
MLRSFQIGKQRLPTINGPPSTINEQNIMKTNWKVMPRGDYKRACDAAIYVTLTPKGRISINRATFLRLGAPKRSTFSTIRLTTASALSPVRKK